MISFDILQWYRTSTMGPKLLKTTRGLMQIMRIIIGALIWFRSLACLLLHWRSFLQASKPSKPCLSQFPVRVLLILLNEDFRVHATDRCRVPISLNRTFQDTIKSLFTEGGGTYIMYITRCYSTYDISSHV